MNSTYIKENRNSVFTIILNADGSIPMDAQVKLDILKSMVKGTGEGVRLRGRKPNPLYYAMGMPGCRSYSGPQDLPRVYASELDVYVRVTDYKKYMENVRAGTSFWQLKNKAA